MAISHSHCAWMCHNWCQSPISMSSVWLGGSQALSWGGWGSPMKILGEGSLYPCELTSASSSPMQLLLCLPPDICHTCATSVAGPLLRSIWPCDNRRPWLGTPHHPQTANNHLFLPSVTHKETTLASFNFSVFFFFFYCRIMALPTQWTWIWANSRT